ncbi:hypothetical protein SNK04_000362 [Fusarium graminearum]
MEPETRATSFGKDAHKTKDNAPKGKTRSNSLFTISSGFTFLLPFLEDPIHRLSGRPLSDKYPTPTLVLLPVFCPSFIPSPFV